MILRLPDLPENIPVAVENEYDPKGLEVEFVDLTYCDKLSLKGTVEKFTDSLSVRGVLKSRFASTCGRCLKRIEQDLSKPFELYLDIKDKVEVDITGELREVLILEHPIQFLCSENCRGLCPHCGIDRNTADCQCEPQIKSRVFDSLKKIIPKLKTREKS